jgi:hypothetical protein
VKYVRTAAIYTVFWVDIVKVLGLGLSLEQNNYKKKKTVKGYVL